MRSGFVVGAAVLGMPCAVAAQERVSVQVYGVVGAVALDAAQTFEAIAETGSARTTGGGAQIGGFWRGAIIDVALTQARITGERVYIDEGAVYRLGLPLRVRLRPFDIAGGWRVERSRLSWWGGGGVSRLRYDEESDGAVDGENVATTAIGPLVAGGVDVRVSRRLLAGLDLRYRRIGGILGAGGASAAFGETSAGGVSAAVRIAMRVK